MCGGTSRWSGRGAPDTGMVLESDLTVLLSLMPSDYIIEEKNAVLQKKENEGFGFVLRGAKGKKWPQFALTVRVAASFTLLGYIT